MGLAFRRIYRPPGGAYAATMKPDADVAQFTLRQLEIFCTVAQTKSLTRAAKQLDVRQPSISQQLSRMESAVGGKLVRYVNNELRLTPAGQYLLDEAVQILAAVDRAGAGLAEFFEGRRGRLVVGALPSAARNLLPAVMASLKEALPGYALDVVDVTPREAAEQLQSRTLDAAIVSTYAVTQRAGLRVTPVMSDRQLLAVPRAVPDLADIADPASDLAPHHFDMLRRTVRYAFGSEHTARVNAWYEALIPRTEFGLRCRAFESALAFVEGGLASAIVPELAVRQGDRVLFDVALYDLPVPPRQTVLMVPEQYAAVAGIRALTRALQAAAAALAPLEVRPVPQFARRAVPRAPGEPMEEAATPL